MQRDGFSTMVVSEVSGLSYRQLAHWSSKGILVPSIQRPKGSGTRSVYSTKDVYVARIMHLVLRVVGPVRTASIARMSQSVREMIDRNDLMPHVFYIIIGDEFTITEDEPHGIDHIVIYPSVTPFMERRISAAH